MVHDSRVVSNGVKKPPVPYARLDHDHLCFVSAVAVMLVIKNGSFSVL